MKLPSITYLTQQASASFRRFPYVLLFAAVAAILSCLIIHLDESVHREFLGCFLMAIGLSVPIAFAAALFSMAPPRFWPISKTVTQALPLLLTAVIFSAFYERHEGWSYFQYVQFWLASLLFVTYAGFITNRDNLRLWNFNQHLVIRAVIAAIFSGTIYLGVIGILAMCDYLFKIHVNPKLYVYTFFVCGYLIFTWMLLAGVGNPKADEGNHGYNRFLKFLLQYILIPLVTIYFAILYVYALKIIATWELPRGGVANLVCAASFFGIITLLLTYPIKNLLENRWIQFYSRIFYLALFPLVVLMSVGLTYRISQYGITESRYLLVVYAIWLLGIAIYFTLNKNKNIKVIPITLSLLTFFTGVGPWSAGTISLHSQQRRLVNLLDTYQLRDPATNMLKSGTKEIPFDDRKQISSIFDYIIDRHGLTTIEPMLTSAIKTKLNAANPNILNRPHYTYYASNTTPTILKQIDVDYVNAWQTNENDTQRFNFSLRDDNQPNNKATAIGSFDYFLTLSKSDYSLVPLGDSGWSVRLDKNRHYVVEVMNPQHETVLELPLIDFVNKLKATKQSDTQQYRQFSEEEMTTSKDTGDVKLLLHIRSISGNTKSDAPIIDYLSAQVFVGIGNGSGSNQKKAKR